MFNSIGAWFYRYLAGIQLNALNTITVHPRMSYDADLLKHIEAEVVTIKGAVRVEWTRISVESMVLSVTLPNNMDAIVSFDALVKNGRCMKLLCDGELLWMREGVNDDMKLLKNMYGVSDLVENPSTSAISIRITSGTYTFMTHWE
jgi:hypothetical protein